MAPPEAHSVGGFGAFPGRAAPAIQSGSASPPRGPIGVPAPGPATSHALSVSKDLPLPNTPCKRNRAP